jgi:hypothetical protein
VSPRERCTGRHLTLAEWDQLRAGIPARRYDLTGRRFGKLVAEKAVARDRHGNIVWLCRCDCGSASRTRATDLMVTKARSCGCGRAWAEGRQSVAR